MATDRDNVLPQYLQVMHVVGDDWLKALQAHIEAQRPALTTATHKACRKAGIPTYSQELLIGPVVDHMIHIALAGVFIAGAQYASASAQAVAKQITDALQDANGKTA